MTFTSPMNGKSSKMGPAYYRVSVGITVEAVHSDAVRLHFHAVTA